MGGTMTTSKCGTAYQMTEDWLAFGNPRISEFAVAVLDTEPKTCHKVYLYVCLYCVAKWLLCIYGYLLQ